MSAWFREYAQPFLYHGHVRPSLSLGGESACVPGTGDPMLYVLPAQNCFRSDWSARAPCGPLDRWDFLPIHADHALSWTALPDLMNNRATYLLCSLLNPLDRQNCIKLSAIGKLYILNKRNRQFRSACFTGYGSVLASVGRFGNPSLMKLGDLWATVRRYWFFTWARSFFFCSTHKPDNYYMGKDS